MVRSKITRQLSPLNETVMVDSQMGNYTCGEMVTSFPLDDFWDCLVGQALLTIG